MDPLPGSPLTLGPFLGEDRIATMDNLLSDHPAKRLLLDDHREISSGRIGLKHELLSTYQE